MHKGGHCNHSLGMDLYEYDCFAWNNTSVDNIVFIWP